MKIGDVAKLAGTTPRTIRYYEEIGLLAPAPDRPSGSHRVYGEDDVDRLRDVLRLKDLLGLSLEELGEVATAESARAALRREWHEDEPDPERRREIIAEALGHLADQLALVRRRKRDLAERVGELCGSGRRNNRPRGELRG
jgi:DNA-binding transcriptional MerR regulator